MPAAYTLTERPKDLGAVATLVHRLRHPLRVKRIRYDGSLPAIQSPSIRGVSDARPPRIEDQWLEAPTRDSSPYDLVEIEDKGEYSEARYGDANLYWNSVVVEASQEGKERMRKVNERKERKRGGVFKGGEELGRATRGHGKETETRPADHEGRVKNGKKHIDARRQQERTVPLIERSSHPRADSIHMDSFPNKQICSFRDTKSNHYITPHKKDAIPELNLDTERLTWNSALNRVLASPYLDPATRETIRARTVHSKAVNGPTGDVDMRAVSMVPNFSYPIASARWCDRCDIARWRPTENHGHQDFEIASFARGHSLGISVNDHDIRNPPTYSKPAASPDSLYDPPTPPIYAPADSHYDSRIYDLPLSWRFMGYC